MSDSVSPKVTTARDLRQKYLSFFAERGHAIIPSAPLVPENDPTVLFTTAGMHPLVPYLLGQPHPKGKRLTNVQKCVRTDDIDEVGDLSHLTFFEMLGNWSLGDYFKKEALAWTWEFLTDVLGLDPDRISVTVFVGDENAPRDEEAASVWRGLGMPQDRIFYLPKKDNWWGPAGQTGPCGPDSEMFYDVGKPACGPSCQPGCSCGKYVEIGNDVFMQYNKLADGSYVPLVQKNVDFGGGVERTTAMLQGKDDTFQTELFSGMIAKMTELSGKAYGESTGRAMRIVADHMRASAFLIADGVVPSNKEHGYILRRLIRRAIRFGRELGLEDFTPKIAQVVVDEYGDVYPEVQAAQSKIADELAREETEFSRTLVRGRREFEKVIAGVLHRGESQIPPEESFKLFDTYGFPISLTRELAAEQGIGVDEAAFDELFRAHQEKSRGSLEQKFAGGLADHSEQTTKLHTATHLLHQALRQVLGTHVSQKGSNITVERLRFDFSHPEKMSEEQIREVERIVNEQIERDLPVSMKTESIDEARAEGALAFFGEKYGDVVRVYTIGDFSKEVCGGPHVTHTGELGGFRIQKEEAVGRGARRIRAVVQEPSKN